MRFFKFLKFFRFFPGLPLFLSGWFAYASEHSGERLPNPIPAQSFEDLFETLAVFVRNNILPVLISLAIIWAGFKFVSASVEGKPEKIVEAKKIFWYVFLGSAIVITASALVEAIRHSL